MAVRQGFEPCASQILKLLMACDFWQNAREIRTIPVVLRSAPVLAEPGGSASVVETFWRRLVAEKNSTPHERDQKQRHYPHAD
jgi:hypothetical protein